MQCDNVYNISTLLQIFQLFELLETTVKSQVTSHHCPHHHWLDMYAVQDHMLRLHLPDVQPTDSIATLPVTTFLPKVEGCVALHEEFMFLVARVLIRYLPDFKPSIVCCWLLSSLPNFNPSIVCCWWFSSLSNAFIHWCWWLSYHSDVKIVYSNTFKVAVSV